MCRLIAAHQETDMALNAEHRINDVVRGIALIAESGRNSLRSEEHTSELQSQ